MFECSLAIKGHPGEFMHSAQANDVRALLAESPLFGGLADAELARLAATSRLIRLARGDCLFNAGEPCQGMHVVASGRMKLFFSSANGHEKVLDIVGRGSSVDDAEALAETAYTMTAQAMTEARVIRIPRQAMVDELEADRQLSLKMLFGLASREYRMLCEIESCTAHNGVQRVVAFLLGEIPAGQAASPAVDLRLGMAKGIIASRLGLTQEHFSRLLKSLSDQGLIHVDQKQVAIPDVARLRALLIN